MPRASSTTRSGEDLGRYLYQAPGTDGLAPLDAAMELPDEKYSYEAGTGPARAR